MRPEEFRRPWLYPKQEAAIYDPRRYSLIEAGTKTGKTFGCIVWLIEKAITEGGLNKNFWWMAPVYPQAEIAFRRLKTYLPDSYRSAKPDNTRLKIPIPNGSAIWFKGSDRPDTLYGEDVYAAVVDEASRAKEESWHALRSTLTFTRGPARLIGNVKGKKNWFYRMARRAEAGEKDMGYHRLVAADAVEAGLLDADEIEDARRTLPKEVFKQLYEAIPGSDDGNPFGPLEACYARLSFGKPVMWGWDLGKKQDWTVGTALDINGYVCAHYRFQMPWPNTIDFITEKTGDVHALIDSTGLGDPIVDALQLRSFHNYEGFMISPKPKQQIMEGLAVAVQREQIHFPEGPISIEMEQFEYQYTRLGVQYSAPSGCHDDCVISLALAWEGYRRKYMLARGSLRETGSVYGFSRTVLDELGVMYDAA